MKYIRDTYGVPARRGARVEYQSDKVGRQPRRGTITSADGAYLRIRFDGDRRTYPAPFHPQWGITYVDQEPLGEEFEAVWDANREKLFES